MSATTQPFETDKDGRPVNNEKTADLAQLLQERTAALRVVIHDADMDQIGYWSKTGGIPASAFRYAQDVGFMPTYSGLRFAKGSQVAYAEFQPIEDVMDGR